LATLDVKRLELADLPAHPQLRAADEVECRAAGLEPAEALRISLSNSQVAWAVSLDGEVVAYWGHAPVSILGNIGVAWLLSTPAAEYHRVAFGRYSISFLTTLLHFYSEVLVQVDLEYHRARKWLRWLGFEEACRSGRFATMRKVR